MPYPGAVDETDRPVDDDPPDYDELEFDDPLDAAVARADEEPDLYGPDDGGRAYDEWKEGAD